MEKSDFQNMVVNFLHTNGFDDIITRFMMSSKVKEMADERWRQLQQNISGIKNSSIEASYGSEAVDTIRRVLNSYTYEMYQSDLRYGAEMLVYGMIQGLANLTDNVIEEVVINVVKRGLIEETQAMLKGMEVINDALVQGIVEDVRNTVLGIMKSNYTVEDAKMGNQRISVFSVIIKQMEDEN